MLIFWEKNITQIHAKNLNNPPPWQNDNNKGDDTKILTVKSESISISHYFEYKHGTKWLTKCLLCKLKDAINNIQNNKANQTMVIDDLKD